jgi:hypothetical protein
MQQRVPDPVKPPRPAARQQQQGAARPGVAVARGLRPRRAFGHQQAAGRRAVDGAQRARGAGLADQRALVWLRPMASATQAELGHHRQRAGLGADGAAEGHHDHGRQQRSAGDAALACAPAAAGRPGRVRRRRRSRAAARSAHRRPRW